MELKTEDISGFNNLVKKIVCLPFFVVCFVVWGLLLDFGVEGGCCFWSLPFGLFCSSFKILDQCLRYYFKQQFLKTFCDDEKIGF